MKKPQPPKAYRDTPCPVSQSRDEIEEFLLTYGADGVSWSTLRTADGEMCVLRFRLVNRIYRFEVELGVAQQDKKQRMRALRFAIKSGLEQAAFGILAFEDVFLAYQETVGEDGRPTTVGRIVQPQLANHQAPMLALPARAGA